MKFKVSDSILSIKPYVPGKPIEEFKREYNISHPVKLASNENPFGFSPVVADAVRDTLDQMNRYPDAGGHRLTEKLANKYGVHQNNVVIGNGSDDIIALLAHAYLDKDDEALMPFPTFLMYEISVKTAGGKPVQVPLKEFSIDLDHLSARITPRTRLIFLTNPFNPTGSIITRAEMDTFMAAVPDDVIVVVDEAYIEFAVADEIYNSLDTPLADPRIVTLRTFSKAYGLAGFRVGYGIMDAEICGILQRIRQPFNVNALAQAAACAALDDGDFLEQSVKKTGIELQFLTRELTKMGYPVLPTQSNFIMVDIKADATTIFTDLLPLGVIVRSMKSYGFDTYLRINAGTRDENRTFLSALKQTTGKD